MAVVTGIAKVCLQKPISLAFKEVGYVMGKKSLIKSLEKMKTAIQAWLVDANSAHLTTQSERLAVEQLICELDELRDLLDVIATRKLIITTTCGNNFLKKVLTWLFSPSLNPVVFSFRDVHRIRALIKELGSIATPHSQLGSMLGRPFENAISSRRARCIETGPLNSETVIGRDVDRDNIISLLTHSASGLEKFSVVSIVGIGGMGKTTVAQCVYSDERVQNHFDVKFWVYVPEELVAKDVVRKMLELATKEKINETTQLTQLQHQLCEEISGKKYLLVIDNIWDHSLSLNWPSLIQQMGFGGRGSMVLTTTRSLRVAKTICTVAQNKYMLGDLEDDDSWRLFKIHAFGHAQDQEFNALEDIGKQIVRKCPNVPLVIRSVGCHLGGHNRTISYWEEFKDKLDSLGRRDGYPDVLETLKLTYDDLDYWLKRCFACFSLFPKGYEFRKNELIFLWIALDLVELPSDKSRSLVDVAKDYIDCLEEEGLVSSQKEMAFFFWEELYVIKMHDVIHDLALSIGGSKYKMVDFESQEVEENIQHISFTKKAKLSKLKMKKQMQSLLLLHDERFLRNERFGDVKLMLKGMSGFEHLRVLGLHTSGLEEVPKTIGQLQLLRYLDLSYNCVIKKLPSSITKLVNLVYLNLNGCYELEEVPEDVNKLQKLIYLDLRDCVKLRKLPIGITKLVNLRELRLHGYLPCCVTQMPLGMKNMSALKRLDLFVANNSNEASGLAELNSLDNLEEDLRIVVYGSWPLSESEARAANLRGKKKLTRLYIDFERGSNRDNNHEKMLEGFQPHTNLKKLEINGYAGGGRLPSWIEDMLSLEEIMISKWEVGHICVGSLGRLPRLKSIIIKGCWNIEIFFSSGSNSSGNYELGLEAIPEDFQWFSSLQRLDISDCIQLKELPEWIDTLTSLKQLTIKGCPELRSLPKQMAKLSNLDSLTIQNCRNLKGIPTAEEDIPCFPILKSLWLENLGIEFVPDVFKGASSLMTLIIIRCKQLKELPEWIDTLTSLKQLYIQGNSGELKERCQKITGQDWHLIQHIPDVRIH